MDGQKGGGIGSLVILGKRFVNLLQISRAAKNFDIDRGGGYFPSRIYPFVTGARMRSVFSSDISNIALRILSMGKRNATDCFESSSEFFT